MASIMKIEDDAALNTYLVKHLQPLTEADPSILAKYVWALLKNNKPKAELQAFCTEKLVDFLGEDSKNFVANLFHALEDSAILICQEELDSKIEDESVPVPANSMATVTTGENVELKSSSLLQRHSEASNLGSTDHEEEGSDDEDDDRNHKHRRRVERSRSLDRDTQNDPLHKRSRSDDDNPTEEFCRGPSFLEKDGLPKRRLGRDQSFGAAAKLGIDSNQRGLSRGAFIMRNDVLGSRFEHQNGLSRGLMARGRGGSPCLAGSREQRAAPVDPSDPNSLTLSSSLSKNLYAGRCSSSRGNPSNSPWLGYNLFTGMTNGTLDHPLDHPLPLNKGMPGSRGVSMSPAVGVGMNIGPAVGVGMNIGIGMSLRPRCPDFEERGYCLRGDLCPMEHGANRIVVEDVQSLSKFNLPVIIPSGLGMALGTVAFSSSSATPYSGVSNIVSRDVNSSALMDSSLFKVGPGSYIGTEPDLYDPDQPLWNTEHPAPLGNSLRKLPPFRRDRESESSVLERSRIQSPEDEVYGRSSVAMGKSQSMGSTQSVWNRIGRADEDDTKDGSFPLIAEASVEILQPPKVLKRESHESVSLSGKRKIDPEERTLRTSKNAAGKGGDSGMPEGEHAVHNLHGGRGSRFPSERAQNTLYVGCVPSHPNRKELLVAHFQKFGDIVDIRVPAYGERVFVQFLRHEDAEAALASPEAVMGNRFIRLSWAKRDSVPLSSMEGITVLPPVAELNNSAWVDVPGLSFDNLNSTKGKQAINALFEANKNKQDSKSGVLPQSTSTQKKQEELEYMRETMEAIKKRREELNRKTDEFRRKLERLSKQGNDTTSELEIDSLGGAKGISVAQASNKDEKGVDDKSAQKPVSFTPLLLEKVLSLSDECTQGLKKDTAKQSFGLGQVSFASLSQNSPKGLRGYSLWSSPAVVGSQWPSSRYKIDNRTTAFRILAPLPDSLLDATILKHHFQSFGDNVNVEMEDLNEQGESLSTEKITVKVTFSTRSAAERAYGQGRWFQGTTLHFSWVNPPTTSIAVSSVNVQVEGKQCGLSIEKGSQDVQLSQTLTAASGNDLDAEHVCEMDGQLENEAATSCGTVLGNVSEEGQNFLQS